MSQISSIKKWTLQRRHFTLLIYIINRILVSRNIVNIVVTSSAIFRDKVWKGDASYIVDNMRYYFADSSFVVYYWIKFIID